MSITFSGIEDGQYEVEIDLNFLMDECQRCGFEKQMKEIYQHEREYAFVSSLKNGVLRYKSETLIPKEIDEEKKKLLFVFGNPAVHSVIHRMFFFSNQNGSKHRMWGKLNKAGVLEQVNSRKNIPIDARIEEAVKRKEIILSGNKEGKYTIGMTTFYSFPTSADGGVGKVEELFGPAINEINMKESKRILNCSYTNDTLLIFLQKSSHKAFLDLYPDKIKDILFWPIRGQGSKGEDLLKKLQKLGI